MKTKILPNSVDSVLYTARLPGCNVLYIPCFKNYQIDQSGLFPVTKITSCYQMFAEMTSYLNMGKIKVLLIVMAIVLCFTPDNVLADISIAHIFNHNMVLQREHPVPVWGKATPGEEVSISFAGQEKQTITGIDGKWVIWLDKMHASNTDRHLTIKGNNSIVLKNILVGEVWLCSGQSNMTTPVKKLENAREEIAAADYTQIRLVSVIPYASTQPLEDFPEPLWWKKCSSSTIDDYSAVGYFFARRLSQELDIPIGIVVSAVSGSKIVPWLPRESFNIEKKLENFIHLKDEWDIQTIDDGFVTEEGLSLLEAWIPRARAALKRGRPIPSRPKFIPTSSLPMKFFNGMINPLIPFPIRGVLWYQGEANVGDGSNYLLMFKALINGWRAVWELGSFPFYFVQLAPSENYSGVKLGEFWESQRRTLSVKNTGMAVITDADSFDDIHPQNKKESGERLAMLALKNDYGRSDVVSSGPIFNGIKTEGNQIIVTFDNDDRDLGTWDGNPLCCFEVSGEDNVFFPGEATIVNDSVSVSSPLISNPVNVRMGWGKGDEPNLSNSSGLPASPFSSCDCEPSVNSEKDVTLTTIKANIWKEPETGIEFRRIMGGCYEMGCGQWNEKCAEDNMPAHKVCVGDFSIGRYEVDRQQWSTVMGKNLPQDDKFANYPVVRVSWHEIQEFIQNLNKKTGETFRLPTEAEWEFVARSGGEKEIYAGGNVADGLAWFIDNSSLSLKQVGTKAPNGLGIFDMSGNVMEWCADRYSSNYYKISPENNPQGPSENSFHERVIRGGSFTNQLYGIRTVVRQKLMPNYSNTNLGFRVVVSN